MKASLLKRITTLEQQATLNARSPLLLVDLSTLTPDEQEAYRTEASTMSTTPSKGYIQTIIIDIHESGRADFQETNGLDDDELEAIEWRRESERRRQQIVNREQVQLAAIALAKDSLPPVPANAYAIDDDD